MISILANAGVPMIFVTLPPMVFLTIPIILIEYWASWKLIQKEPPRRKWFGLAVANAGSTFIGWPIAWVILVAVQMITGGGGAYGLKSPLAVILSVTQQAPWLIPYESELYWMVPAAMFVLLIPFFFVSVYSERFILGLMWKEESRESIARFSWKAHFYSYTLLVLVVLGYAWQSISSN